MISPITRTRTRVPNYKRHPGSEWIDAHRDNLPNDHWVAANAGGRIAVDPTIDGLMGQLRLKDIDPAEVVIAFITSDSA